MSEGQPPVREPHYFDNQSLGWPLADCARGLLWTLWGFVYSPRDFVGSANGHAWIAHRDEANARIAFTSDRGDGHVQLSVHPSNWVKVEVYVSGARIFRAWAEEVWEEKELWPDGADGVVPPNACAPGCISKRGAWLQLECEKFPGMPMTETGNWAIEIRDEPVPE